MSSILIVLREHHPQTGVDNTEHDGVGHHLNQMGRPGRQRQEDAGGEEDEQDDRDDYV